jgi:alpha-beta hydrolase superfamily lysophospholipase
MLIHHSVARRIARWARITILAQALAVPFGYIGISIVSAHLLTRPSNVPSRLDPRLVGQPRAWSTRTHDGLTLRGWYYPTGQRKNLVVCVHGMMRQWQDLAGVARDLHRRGHDVLLFDLRGHGSSDPARLSMGWHEREDLRAVLAWAKREGYPPERVGWVGFSMGATTILLEGLRNSEIRNVVLDSPYGDLPELLDVQLTRYSGLPKFFNAGILAAAEVAYGVRTRDLVPNRLARNWDDRPVLLIHGEADRLVPIDQGRALARAIGSACSLKTVPAADHVRAYLKDPVGYTKMVDDFLRQSFAAPEQVPSIIAEASTGLTR